MKHYWDTIESPFATFAAWVDEEGRLLRFHLRADGRGQGGSRRRNAMPGRWPKCAARWRNMPKASARNLNSNWMPKARNSTSGSGRRCCDIPFGTTTSYGAVAKTIGYPKAARAVGAANGANPIALIVPCHRVIGSDGSLTGYGGGLPLKRKLLEHEARVCGTRSICSADIPTPSKLRMRMSSNRYALIMP